MNAHRKRIYILISVHMHPGGSPRGTRPSLALGQHNKRHSKIEKLPALPRKRSVLRSPVIQALATGWARPLLLWTGLLSRLSPRELLYLGDRGTSTGEPDLLFLGSVSTVAKRDSDDVASKSKPMLSGFIDFDTRAVSTDTRFIDGLEAFVIASKSCLLHPVCAWRAIPVGL